MNTIVKFKSMKLLRTVCIESQNKHSSKRQIKPYLSMNLTRQKGLFRYRTPTFLIIKS